MLIYWKNTINLQTMKTKVVIIDSQVKHALKFHNKTSIIDENNNRTSGDFRLQFRHRGQCNTEKIITSICKSNTMKQEMLNSQINSKSQAPMESL